MSVSVVLSMGDKFMLLQTTMPIKLNWLTGRVLLWKDYFVYKYDERNKVLSEKEE